VLFLDEHGRRVAQISAIGFTFEQIARIAQAAGSPFAAYDLGVRHDASV